MIPINLTSFIVHLLNFWHKNDPAQTLMVPAAAHNPVSHFELRHQYAVSSTARVLFADVSAGSIYGYRDGKAPYQIRMRRMTTYRPPSFYAHSQARIRSIRHAQSQDLHWDEEEVIGPDVESRETLLELAKMTSNAYVEPGDPYWYDLEGNWSKVKYLSQILFWVMSFTYINHII
jgi:lipase ATG15